MAISTVLTVKMHSKRLARPKPDEPPTRQTIIQADGGTPLKVYRLHRTFADPVKNCERTHIVADSIRVSYFNSIAEELREL